MDSGLLCLGREVEAADEILTLLHNKYKRKCDFSQGLLTSIRGDEIFQTVMQQTGTHSAQFLSSCGFISKALTLPSVCIQSQMK